MTNSALGTPIVFDSSSEGLILIEQKIISSATTNVDFTSISSAYDNWLLIYSIDAISDTSGSIMVNLQISDDNGSTFKSTGYDSDLLYSSTTTSDELTNAVNSTSFTLGRVNGSDSAPDTSGMAYLFGMGLTGSFPGMVTEGTYQSGSSTLNFQGKGLYETEKGDVDAIRISAAAGTIDAAIFSLYGFALS